MNLCRRRDFFIEIPRDVDADGVVILPFGMGTDRCQGTAPFDGTIFTDDVMVANSCPAIGQVGPVNGRCRRIAVGNADVMDDDHVRFRPQQ